MRDGNYTQFHYDYKLSKQNITQLNLPINKCSQTAWPGLIYHIIVRLLLHYRTTNIIHYMNRLNNKT